MSKYGCEFTSVKGKTKCNFPVDTYFGFCKKHQNTYQAKTRLVDQNEKITHGRSEQIIRNEYGRFEHQETHLIFDMSTQKAYGIQLPNGEVIELSDKDIEICKERGWSYQIKKKIIEEKPQFSFDDSEMATIMYDDPDMPNSIF